MKVALCKAVHAVVPVLCIGTGKKGVDGRADRVNNVYTIAYT